MKRKLYCLVPWMAITAAAHGQTRPADVLYCYLDDTPTHGMRVGDDCFVPVDDVAKWGWHVDVRSDNAHITAEGSDFNIGLRTVGGKPSIPVRAALTKMGITSEWITNTDSLQVLGEVSKVSVDSGRISLIASMRFKPKAFVLSNPNRIVLDFTGIKLTSKTVQSLEGGVRVSQYKPNVVRLVIQTPGTVDVSQISTEPTRSVEMELAGTAPTEDKQTEPPVKDEIPSNKQKSGGETTNQTKSEPTKSESVKTEPIKSGTSTSDAGIVDGSAQLNSLGGTLPLVLTKEDERSIFLNMKFPPSVKPSAQFEKPSPNVLTITLNGLFLALSPDFKLESESITGVSSQKTPKGTVLTLTMSRPLGAEVYTEGSNVSIQIFKPNIGDGKLVGKVIVVDPGHGGSDGGAGAAGYHEKDFNLSIAKMLSARLSEAGATVIMTRKTDVFIPLTTRADIANQSHADFFISCHINDTGGTGSASGGITFHHKGNIISKVLAECIQQQIAAVSGIPSMGAWSDGKIYSQGGFSVLRNIKMVGVLIEYGFLNNEHDRKRLITPEFQDAVTRAVVKGLKVYLGDAKAK